MNPRIDIYATCPACGEEFYTGLYAWTLEGAQEIIQGLASTGNMIWLRGEVGEVRERIPVPKALRCRSCSTETERTLLAPSGRVVPCGPVT